MNKHKCAHTEIKAYQGQIYLQGHVYKLYPLKVNYTVYEPHLDYGVSRHYIIKNDNLMI